jgi:hypothetical protein
VQSVHTCVHNSLILLVTMSNPSWGQYKIYAVEMLARLS